MSPPVTYELSSEVLMSSIQVEVRHRRVVEQYVDPAERADDKIDQRVTIGRLREMARLQGHHRAFAARTMSTVACAASTVGSHPTAMAPSRANVRAASRPMLPPVPVMMLTFF
jgi:hypothetical protein